MVRLFGPIAVLDGPRRLGPRDFGGVKPKQILELLLLARGHPVAKDRLADALWGEQPPVNIAGTLETHVSVLRRNLAPDGRGRLLVVTEREAYRFAVEHADIDIVRFDELVAGVRRPGDRQRLDEALALARGDLLEDEPYAEWAEAPRAHYREQVVRALVDAGEAALADAEPRAALDYLEEALTKDPVNERAYRAAMVARYELGDRADSLRVAERQRRALAAAGEELDAETEALADAIRAGAHPRLLATGLVSGGTRPHALDGTSPLPLLGRRRELAVLRDALQSSLAGSFELLLIDGEAGSGKSRLLDEFALQVNDARLGRARCSPLERALPHSLLAMALRSALADVALERTAPPALAKILPEVGSRGGARDVPLVSALEALAEFVRVHAPIVFTLDDLQWADASSIASIDYLQRRCAAVPVLVVGAVRPEELPDKHSIHRLAPTGRLALEPLSAEELAPLRLPDLHERTGGHPLFVAAALGAADQELSQAIRDHCLNHGAYRARLLATASVLEQPFDPQLLAAILGSDLVEVVEQLERLCERRLLRIEGLRFAYRFPLMREVLYESLSPARRKLLEQRAWQVQKAAGRPTALRARRGA